MCQYINPATRYALNPTYMHLTKLWGHCLRYENLYVSSLIHTVPSCNICLLVINQTVCLSLGTSSSANSPTAFQWLLGYEACRTGWDRFSKPHMDSQVNFDPGSGFPETWPWSHIITPNMDGSTEIAREHLHSLVNISHPYCTVCVCVHWNHSPCNQLHMYNVKSRIGPYCSLSRSFILKSKKRNKSLRHSSPFVDCIILECLEQPF